MSPTVPRILPSQSITKATVKAIPTLIKKCRKDSYMVTFNSPIPYWCTRGRVKNSTGNIIIDLSVRTLSIVWFLFEATLGRTDFAFVLT
jgi:hypothetical protein